MYNAQFPPLHSNQTTSHYIQLSKTNQQTPHQTQPTYTAYLPPKQSLSSTQPKLTPHNTDYAWSSEDNFDLSDTEETSQKHEWQTTRHKRKRINHQTSTELAAPIKTNNRFKSLNDLPCKESWLIEPPNPMDSTPTKRELRPPPIYIYDVNNYKAMVDDLSKVVEEETYHTTALPNNTIKVAPHTHPIHIEN